MLLNFSKTRPTASLLRKTVAAAGFTALSLSFASAPVRSQEYRRVEYSLYRMEKVSGHWFRLSSDVSIGGRVFANAGQVQMNKGDNQAVFSNRVGADLLEAHVGIDDSINGQAEARFAVKGDGQMLWQSDWIAKGDPPQKVSVPIKGYSGITLMITHWRYQDGLGSGCLFAEPKLVRLHPVRRAPGRRAPVKYARIGTAEPVKVLVNGRALHFDGLPAMRVGTRVLVPMRPIFQALGANVTYDAASGDIVATSGTATDPRIVQMKASSYKASLNGTPLSLDIPPVNASGTTLVPLRFVAEATGAQVNWNTATRTVTVVSGPSQVTLR